MPTINKILFFPVLCCLFLFALFLVVPAAYAENFYIQNYDVLIEANEKKSVKVTENIDVFFLHPLHGIIREIPHKKASITNIRTQGKSSISNIGKTVEIKLGSADKTVSGIQNYRITYNYNYHDNKNEFYHNVIGPEWEVPIKNAKFTLIMPKPIDPSKAGLSIGGIDAAGFESGAEFDITDNVKITGKTLRELRPNEGITFRAEVPPGYFETYRPYAAYISMFLLGLLALASFYIWDRYGKDDHVTPVVTFKIPVGLNAIQAELAYKGEASDKGLSAMIVELANKGYVRINNQSDSFVLEKLKPYEQASLEQDYLNALFGSNSSISKAQIEKSQTYYLQCRSIVRAANKEREIIYDIRTIKGLLPQIMTGIMSAIAFITLFSFCDFSIRSFFSADSFSIAALFFIFGTPFFSKEWNKYAKALLLTGFAIFAVSFLILGYASYENINVSVLGLACLAVSWICADNLPKRSPKGKHLLSELEGLRKFIQTAEKNELEEMAEKNPRQFYDILPYAFVLGVSDVWIKKLNKFLEAHPVQEKPAYDIGRLHGFSSNFTALSKPSRLNGGIKTSHHSSSHGGGGRVGRGGGGGGGHSW